MTDIAHLGPVELLTPEGERSLAFFTEVMGMEIEGQEGAIGLPARLGRLPALQPRADRVRHLGDGVLRAARVEP